jgi:SNF2 family DNA or RNA helicase
MKTLSTQSITLFKLKKHGFNLFPYQKKSLTWLLNREKKGPGGFLCDEMGLGKTIQTISLVLASKSKKTLLILPASLLHQWKTQLEEFSDYLKVYLYHGNHGTRKLPDFDDTKSVVITSYNLIINDNHTFSEIHWDRIILDECHYIRNSKSVIFNKIMQLKCDKKWGLSGTPIQNYLGDIVVLFKFIGFEEDYIKLNLKTLINKHVMRRTKEDVVHEHSALDLPTLRVKNIKLNIKEQNEEDLKEDLDMRNFSSLEMILRRKQLSISPQLYLNGISKKFNEPHQQWSGKNRKFDFIIRQIKTQLEKDNRIIVFTTFNFEISYLSKNLKKHDINVDHINGRIPQEDRKSIIADDSIQVLLIQIDCGGTGLNLQKYNIAYFTSPTWNPSLEDQAVARLYRIGQKKEVEIYRVTLSNSIDNYINFVQKNKRKLIKKHIISSY